uniref:Uncharacterized protein n=1 Tax=Romanomermis culicivorax TaxID=13658 RepID=A0A915HNP0_ROMCU
MHEITKLRKTLKIQKLTFLLKMWRRRHIESRTRRSRSGRSSIVRRAFPSVVVFIDDDGVRRRLAFLKGLSVDVERASDDRGVFIWSTVTVFRVVDVIDAATGVGRQGVVGPDNAAGWPGRWFAPVSKFWIVIAAGQVQLPTPIPIYPAYQKFFEKLFIFRKKSPEVEMQQ